MLYLTFYGLTESPQCSGSCRVHECCNLRGLEDYPSKRDRVSENNQLPNFREELPVREERPSAFPENLRHAVSLRGQPVPRHPLQSPRSQGAKCEVTSVA